jgi:hypothetical protein
MLEHVEAHYEAEAAKAAEKKMTMKKVRGRVA